MPERDEQQRRAAREGEALARVARGFGECFGQPGQSEDQLRFVRSPYRVCPLGAHVDHQDGQVTGMAIDHGVTVAFATRDDATVRAASADFAGQVTFDLQAVPPAVPGEWGNFLRGAVDVLRQRFGAPAVSRGVDLFLAGELPVGGLSSSAAVSVGYLLALEAANDLAVTPEENITLARAIENEYIGLRSGVLDQSMILLGEAGRLLRLDCRTGERSYAAFGELREPRGDGSGAAAADEDLPAIAVAYSGLSESHGLVSTGYNRRVGECQEAAAQLLALAGQSVPEGGARLRDVPPEVFERYRDRLPAELARRAAHYFGEQDRVAAGATAWAEGDAARFGQLVAESGRSSIENYECGAPELATLYHALVESPGVYGARFSGAGFRGSCLALVRPQAMEEVGARVRAVYARAHPEHAPAFGFFRCASGPGAGVVEAP